MAKNDTLAICPGTFDPVTYGHLDLIDRALKIFDRVIVAVAENAGKDPLFSLEERLDMVRRVTANKPGVRVESFEGLIVEYAMRKKALALIRGVRMLSDFEYEFQMALTNRKLEPRVETLFLMPNESYAYLTSRLIKEIAKNGGETRSYVPKYVHGRLAERFGRDKRRTKK
ncbi:MAG: pantetheine-phosphate adenylyltransferase [Candidatus Omnitrophica bacterium]|jgi:pantetheine-phosphate adenylyltransferase|nr:pantetheine-phosphate adenylyltransferase [Candidatus Omnitrophota bacterium]